MGRVLQDTTDFLGMTDNKGKRHDRKVSDQQRERSNKLTDEQLAFQRAQYNKWQDIYGPLQEDLGTYFKNLNGEDVTAKKLQAVQQESQAAQHNIDQSLAQRGLGTSGLEAQALTQNSINTANSRANIRANQDQAAALQKMQFLGLGLGQGAQMLGVNANVSNSGVNATSGMSNNAMDNATSLSKASTDAMNTMYGTAFGALMSSVNSSGGSSGGSGGGAQSSIQSAIQSGIIMGAA